MGVRRLCALVVAVSLSFALVACAGDPEPKIETSSPSPSVSPSASPSEVEASASPVAEESPEDFIRRWARLETDMQNSGDSAQYRSVTGGCIPCTNTADLVDQYYEAGGYVKTQGRRVVSIKRPDNSLPTFTVKVDSAPTEYKTDASGDTQSFLGGVSIYEVELSESNTGWNVANYAELAS